MHGHAVRVARHQDDLAGMAADANVETQGSRSPDHAEPAAHRSHRTVEYGHEAVTRGVELASAMVGYLLPHGRVMSKQQIAPGLVADPLDGGRRAHDVAEQQRDHEAVVVVRRPRENSSARPL